jgi:hypothetical protein
MPLTKSIVVMIMLGAAFFCIAEQNRVSADDHSKKEAKAVKAANSWLAIVDAGNYAESWAEAAAYFKSALTKTQWRQSLNVVRKPLGKLVSRRIESKTYHTSLPGAPDGEYVVIQYKSSFKNKKSAVETVTPMRDKDGKWRVSGYYIK